MILRSALRSAARATVTRSALLALAIALSIATAARAQTPTQNSDKRARTTAFASRLSAAIAAHDAKKAAALFASAADVSLVGDARVAHGRAAIEERLSAIFARYKNPKLTIGRTWIGSGASVIEIVFNAHRAGAVGALAVTFDDAGLVTTQRLYVDEVTLIVQRDPKRLPAEVKVRAVAARAPSGSDVHEARDTPGERKNLAAANAMWAAMNAHDPVGAMRIAADDYVYDDYSGPAPLHKAETQKLVTDFFALVPDFKIVDKPIQLAAGDDVVTEMVENATYKGQPIVLHSIDVKHFLDGKVDREWQFANYVEVMTQLLKLDPLAQ